MLSILIPVYNYDIRPLVNELDLQARSTDIKYEILIVDDCSSQIDIAEANKEVENLSYCTYLRNKQNLGRTATRSVLAKKATYEWLLFLDADVMPKDSRYLERFLTYFQHNPYDLIFGGVSYTKEKPGSEYLLKWTYGHQRIAQSAIDRKKDPYQSVASTQLLIQKHCFVNNTLEIQDNLYGIDRVFSYYLEKNKIRVLHIDNPVIHMDLESYKEFLDKTKQVIDCILHYEKLEYPHNYNSIQKAYLKLHRFGLYKAYLFLIDKIKSKLQNNLYSTSPNVRYVDMLKLYWYASAKNNQSP